MAYAYLGRGDTAAAIRYLEPATRLSNNPAIKQMLDDLTSVFSSRRP
jgi:hypothetical protein